MTVAGLLNNILPKMFKANEATPPLKNPKLDLATLRSLALLAACKDVLWCEASLCLLMPFERRTSVDGGMNGGATSLSKIESDGVDDFEYKFRIEGET